MIRTVSAPWPRSAPTPGWCPRSASLGPATPKLGVTKAGDPLLREALYIAADQARRVDPQLGAKYARLMSGDRHHDSAICHIAANLLTRITTCWRNGEHYVIRDLDGRPITARRGQTDRPRALQGRPRNTATTPPLDPRHNATRQATGRESQRSQSAPTSRPVNATIPSPQMA